MSTATYNPNVVLELPLGSIYADEEFNCRGYFSPAEVMDLAKAIREEGLIQPITVEPYHNPKKPDKEWRILAGYRRFKAHQVNQAETIRALVKEGMSPVEARLLNLTENLSRKDLNMLQEAEAIAHFREAGWTEMEVANRVGKSRGWVQERFMLLSLPPELQEEAAAGMLSGKLVRQVFTVNENYGKERAFEFYRDTKEAKIKGKVREIKPGSVVKVNSKKIRSIGELNELQDTIITYLGHSLATKVIAFACGNIDDFEMHEAIAMQCVQAGKFYIRPENLVSREIKEPVAV